jgi:GxxExxY protein
MEIAYRELTEEIIGAAIEVHRELGPGLLESAYEAALAYELTKRGVAFERQAALPVHYKDVLIEIGYRLDLVVANEVVVELKSVDRVDRIHEAQLMTYLKLSGKKVGLLINFNVTLLKDGITRRIL